MPLEFSQESRQALDSMKAEYPELRSVLIPALKLAQKDHGSLTKEVIALAAAEAGVTEAVAAGVATFYHNLHTGPVGRHMIMVCTTISCQLAGADAVVSRFEELLGLTIGGTTGDGLISLIAVECLACCGNSPAVQVDFDYFESFQPEQCEGVVEALRAGRHPEGGAGVPGGDPVTGMEVGA